MIITVNFDELADYGFEQDYLLDDNWEDLLDCILNFLYGRYEYEGDVDVYNITDDYIELSVDDDFDGGSGYDENEDD